MQPIEIDAAVAKALGMNVLGVALCFRHCSDYWVPFNGQGGNVRRPVYLYDCCCEFRETNDADYFGHIAGCLEVVPEFSTDIKMAWKLTENVPDLELMLEDDNEWFCYISEPARAGTAPLAICHAFLKFMGEEDAAAS